MGLQAIVEIILGVESRIAEKETSKAPAKGKSLERRARQLPPHAPNSCSLSNRHSHGAHSAHKK